MNIKCTLPDGTTKILKNVTEKIYDRIPQDWKTETLPEEEKLEVAKAA
jgi:hypothetical protein